MVWLPSGVVPPTTGNAEQAESELVLKGVVRVEKVTALQRPHPPQYKLMHRVHSALLVVADSSIMGGPCFISIHGRSTARPSTSGLS